MGQHNGKPILQDNPLTAFVDLIISVILSAVIPIPLISHAVGRYKTGVLLIVVSMCITGAGLVVTILLFVTSPFFLSMVKTGNISPASVTSLSTYIEAGFSDTDIPLKNPFGGSGISNTITTVNYHEVENIIWNGEEVTETEQGIDLVPNTFYFLTNKAAKLAKEPIIFSTLTGTANTYTDRNGALTVEITNAVWTIKTIYIHLQEILVASNTLVHAGQPIGVMGSSGMSTGPHLEYQVRLHQNGSWIAANPYLYIQ